MANFRSFTLYNITETDKINLNEYSGYLATVPSGLGIYLKNSYLDVGSKRVLTYQKSGFQPVTMTVNIYGSTRQDVESKYANLRNFISKYRADGFKLGYIPYPSFSTLEERRVDCDIKILDKGEKATSRYMAIPLTIEPRTLWRVDVQDDSVLQNDDTNKWAFLLDSNIDGVTAYDVMTPVNQGEQEISVVGYDKSELPQGLNFEAEVTRAGVTYKMAFSLGDFVEQSSGVYVAEKEYLKEYSAHRSLRVTIDTAQGRVYACPRYSAIPSSDVSDFTYEITPEGTYCALLKLTAGSTIENKNIEYAIAYYKWDGSLGLVRHTKPAGEKYSYVGFPNFSSIAANNPRGSYLDYEDVGVDSTATWKLSGALYKGTSNYVEAFALDAHISNYYNIAMFSGAVIISTIANDGDTEIPLRVRVEGAAQNPSIRIFKKNTHEVVQQTKVNYTIPAGAHIEIDSDPENTGAWVVYSDGTITNIIEYLDQTTNMFLTVPKGEYDVQITDEGGNNVTTTFFYKKEYLGA